MQRCGFFCLVLIEDLDSEKDDYDQADFYGSEKTTERSEALSSAAGDETSSWLCRRDWPDIVRFKVLRRETAEDEAKFAFKFGAFGTKTPECSGQKNMRNFSE